MTEVRKTQIHQWRRAARARLQEGGAVMGEKKGPSDKRRGMQKSMRRQGYQMDTRKGSQEIGRRKEQPIDCEKEGQSDYEKEGQSDYEEKVLSNGLMGGQT